MLKDIVHLYDAEGNLVGVQLSADLWRKVEPFIKMPENGKQSDDLNAFEDFLRFWDFRYEYEPSVECPLCSSSTPDWRTDNDHPFRLKNANIGGLLVFHCENCGATIRQKYFKDHMAVEASPHS